MLSSSDSRSTATSTLNGSAHDELDQGRATNCLVGLSFRFANSLDLRNDLDGVLVTKNFISGNCTGCGALQAWEIELHHASCNGIVYTIPQNAISFRRDDVLPLNRSKTGYGRKIPTRFMIKYDTGLASALWRRVYVMQYGNAGSAYILINRRVVFLDSDTEHSLEVLK